MTLSCLFAACWRRSVVLFAQPMPLGSPSACMAFSALCLLTASFLLPQVEIVAGTVPILAESLDGCARGWPCLRACEGLTIGAAYLCAGIFQARCLQLCYPHYYDPYGSGRPPGGVGRLRLARFRRKRPGLMLAGMRVEEEDLRTSVLVTGVTGSAKTAGVLMPALAQLFRTYNEETPDELSRERFQKIGGFIPEVKGDLVDGCIYLAHEAGRCVSRDVQILSPACRIPVVRYRDERGRFWHLSARGGAGGSDAGEILPRLVFPAGHPRAGRRVSEAVFESPADAAAVLPGLAACPFALKSARPRFVGWRWRGGRLLRVAQTVPPAHTLPLPDAAGGLQWAEPPRSLTVDGVGYVDNGLHYNLVDARLPATEAAERITRLVALARGAGTHGENDYFYDQGRKLIAACISLHRAVETVPCTAVDIVRLATRDGALQVALAALEEKVLRLRAAAAAATDPEAAGEAQRREIVPLEELAAFFRDEWQRLVADGKTANVIRSTISSAFDVFLRDPDLAETFCRPSTFSFEDVVQSGKVIGLVPGDRYEQLARMLGTACKLDFQSTMLSRGSRADLNATRLALYFADECHKYIVAGSATAGDPSFMNLSRSNNVVNICATQSYAWIVEVIGRDAANVYISAFGVQFWLQQTDPETRRRAAEICGLVTRERVSAEHNLDFSGIRGALGSGRELVIRRQVRDEEGERHRAEDFAQLDVGDVIAYNKGRPGRMAKVVKGRVAYLFCTQKPHGAAAVTARVREYYRELLENLTHERGQSARWDCRPSRPAEASLGGKDGPGETVPARLDDITAGWDPPP